MSAIDTPTLAVVGDVLSLELDGHSLKCKLPRGERGAAGRDGISIRGEPGAPGEQGVPGRDSTVPGPKGDKGDRGEMGNPGMTPEISVGTVCSGDVPQVILSGTIEKPVLNFVLPKGDKGEVGRMGRDGKHGNHEYIQLHYPGNNPQFSNEWLAAHVVMDGKVDLPEMTESDIGSWVHIKTFDRAAVLGLVEGGVHLDKTGAKFVVMPYGGTFKFTKF